MSWVLCFLSHLMWLYLMWKFGFWCWFGDFNGWVIKYFTHFSDSVTPPLKCQLWSKWLVPLLQPSKVSVNGLITLLKKLMPNLAVSEISKTVSLILLYFVFWNIMLLLYTVHELVNNYVDALLFLWWIISPSV